MTIENLASNAIKFGSPDAVVTLELKEENQRVTISVHNHGSYLTPPEQADLFNRYYARNNGVTSSSQRGWGLGLTVVRGIVEAHGGSIQVESSLKHGTLFLVTIFQAACDKSSAQNMVVDGQLDIAV